MKNDKQQLSNVFRIIGSNPDTEREVNDFYATDPIAINSLLEKSGGGVKLRNPILEPSCGKGHLSERLKEYGYDVKSMDLIDRGYEDAETGIDFLTFNEKWPGDIVTNPPFKLTQEFIEHALDICETRSRVYMFLKVQYLEGKERRKLFDRKQLKTVYVFSERVTCDRDCEFTRSSAIAYAWFEFEKDWDGDPTIKWIDKVDKIIGQQELF